ncbi:hypothetical protein AMECASPLE_001481 [Ameca splendens]|uniref:Uncharacterized protein n=1 Tax=Ameca splendens TaxID=208324 RepID=A0ABV0ZUJ1_9TELE
MENIKPVKEVLPLPRHPTPLPVTSTSVTPAASVTLHTSGSIQHVHLASSVVSSFNHLRPPERDLTPMSQMKPIKSLKHVGLTAVFTGQAVSHVVKSSNEPYTLLKVQTILNKNIHGHNYIERKRVLCI